MIRVNDFLELSDDFGPIDVSEWEINAVPVAGRYPKHELINGGERYIVKLAAYKQNGDEVPYHVSEYISCRTLKSIGYDVQNVWMSEFHGQPSCLIHVFAEPLITFEGLGTSTLSQENLLYDLDMLGELFNEGKFAGVFEEYLWDTFLCDVLINNLDRHPNNWGFYKRNGVYVNAPLIDNASSLYSINAFSVKRMGDIDEYIRKFGRSAIQHNGGRHSFRDIVLKEKSPVFAESRLKFKKRLNDIDLSSLGNIKQAWPQYNNYIDFVKQYFERQVNWLNEKL
jgi:hypothetical protein